MKTRRCWKCKEEKPLTEFHVNRRNQLGRQSQCKVCANKYHREYHIKNPDVSRRSSLKYYYKNRDRINRELRERRKRIA